MLKMDKNGDFHVCFLCNSIIQGLENYVLHRKNDCTNKNIKDSSTSNEKNDVSTKERGASSADSLNSSPFSPSATESHQNASNVPCGTSPITDDGKTDSCGLTNVFPTTTLPGNVCSNTDSASTSTVSPDIDDDDDSSPILKTQETSESVSDSCFEESNGDHGLLSTEATMGFDKPTTCIMKKNKSRKPENVANRHNDHGPNSSELCIEIKKEDDFNDQTTSDILYDMTFNNDEDKLPAYSKNGVLHSRNDNLVRNQGLPSDTDNEFGLNKGLEDFTCSPWRKSSTQKEGKCHTVTEKSGEENVDTFLITNDVESIKVDDEAEKNEANTEFNSIKVEIASDEEIEIEETVKDSLALADVHICHVCDMKLENGLMVAKHLLSSYHKSRSLAYPQAHLEMMEKYDEFVVKFCPYQCAICRYYFKSYEDFQEHCQTADHKSHCKALSGEIVCTLCDFKTHSCTDIEEHLLSIDHLEALRKSKKIFILKEQPGVPRCKHCGLEFRSYAGVLQHVQQEHAVKTQTSRNVRNGVCCPYCEKKLPSKAALNRHLLFSHENSLKTKNTEQKEALTRQTEIKRTELIDDNHDAKTDKMSEVSASAGDEQTSHIVKQGKISSEKSAQIDKNQTNKIKIPTDDNSDDHTDIVPVKKTEQRRKQKQQKSDKPKKTFKCDHCDLTVSDYKELGEHYKDEHADETKRCEPCDKVFHSEKAYNAHCISKSHKVQSMSNISGVGSNVFECEICHESFPDKNYRDYHTTYIHFHPSEASLKKERETNSITYEKHKDFIDHMDANCTKSERLLCPICEASLQKATMMAHLRTHTGEAPFVCKLCTGIAFYSRNGLRKHLFQHYIKSNHCNICSKDFKSLSAFRKHRTVHMAVKRGEKHVCDVCGVTFPILTRLMTHKLRHSEKSFPCDFPGCHMTFYFKGECTRHKKEVHEKEKTFLCDLCAYGTTAKYKLERHRKTHMGERKFPCEHCSYKAGNLTHLKRHMRIHIGAKPFLCPYCNYACNTHENIRKHILSKIHPGKKVYPCKFCDFGTNEAKEFHKHMVMTHEKEVGRNFNKNAMMKFAGLYKEEFDPQKAEEGTEILQSQLSKAPRRTKQHR